MQPKFEIEFAAFSVFPPPPKSRKNHVRANRRCN